MKVNPNPATDYLVFECPDVSQGFITVTDMYGCFEDKIKIFNLIAYLNTSNFKPGMYVFSTYYKGVSVKGKFIVVK